MQPFFPHSIIGAAVAKYSGQYLHKKLLEEPAFADKKYDAALRDAFLKIDQDLRNGRNSFLLWINGKVTNGTQRLLLFRQRICK